MLGPVIPADSFFVPDGSDSFGQAADPDCDFVAAADGPAGTLGT